jgi:hypothetical protein
MTLCGATPEDAAAPSSFERGIFAPSVTKYNAWKKMRQRTRNASTRFALEAQLIPRPQPVPDPRLRQHELRALGVGFDLLAELADIDAQILRVRQFVP